MPPSPSMPISPKSACYADLRSRILRMDLAPGAELDETQLAAGYGLSRTPLREVFQGLAGEGYVTLERHRGARVTLLGVTALRALLRSAPLVLVNVARLAAENRTPDQLETLRHLQDSLILAVEGTDAAEAALIDHMFQETLGDMAANPYLQPALQRLLIDHTRLASGYYDATAKKDKKLVKKAMQAHDAMIIAVTDQSAEAAAEAALTRWTLAHEQIERSLNAAPLPVDVFTEAEPG